MSYDEKVPCNKNEFKLSSEIVSHSVDTQTHKVIDQSVEVITFKDNGESQIKLTLSYDELDQKCYYEKTDYLKTQKQSAMTLDYYKCKEIYRASQVRLEGTLSIMVDDSDPNLELCNQYRFRKPYTEEEKKQRALLVKKRDEKKKALEKTDRYMPGANKSHSGSTH
jgi:hypothetical protein